MPRAGAARLAITVFALFAFLFQSLVVQTHIHGAAPLAAATAPAAFDRLASHEQQPDKFPPANDPANCPICQELLHAGSFVAPAAAGLLLSTVATTIDVVVAEIVVLSHGFSHSWKSRAPPLA